MATFHFHLGEQLHDLFSLTKRDAPPVHHSVSHFDIFEAAAACASAFEAGRPLPDRALKLIKGNVED